MKNNWNVLRYQDLELCINRSFDHNKWLKKQCFIFPPELVWLWRPRYSLLGCQRFKSSGMWCCVVGSVFKDCTAFIFSIKQWKKGCGTERQGVLRWCGWKGWWMKLWLDSMSGSDKLGLVQGDGNDAPSTRLTSQKTLAFSKLGCLWISISWVITYLMSDKQILHSCTETENPLKYVRTWAMTSHVADTCTVDHLETAVCTLCQKTLQHSILTLQIRCPNRKFIFLCPTSISGSLCSRIILPPFFQISSILRIGRISFWGWWWWLRTGGTFCDRVILLIFTTSFFSFYMFQHLLPVHPVMFIIHCTFVFEI